MRRRLLGLSVALALTAPAGAADKPTPAARLEAIKKEVADARAEYYEAVSDLDEKKKDDVEKAEKLSEALDKKQEAGFAEALKIAQADPKSDAGFAAAEWLLTTPRAYYVAVGKPLLELARTHYATDPRIGKAIAILAYYPPHERAENHLAAVRLLQAVAEKNPDRTARGQAALGLAWLARNKYRVAEYRRQPNADELAAAAEKQFEAVLKDYGDCKNLRTQGARRATATLAGEAKGQLFELQHLRIGKVAPDIIGEDLDGVKFRLSDYRGKVVVLDFWGDW